MVQEIIKLKSREITGRKVNKKRKEGIIPAVVYGNDFKSENLWVNELEMKKAYATVGESSIISLDIEGRKVNALIHDIQLNTLNRGISHVDFLAVNMNEEIETEVPLEFIGESEAVKALGGVLIKSLDKVTVACLPSDLPAKIEVDISKLKTFDDHIKVGDLKFSAKISVKNDTEIVIASVTPPRSEEEMASLNEKVEEDVTKVKGVIKETPEKEKAEEKK